VRAYWGYHPRYEAKYDFSIKKAKYALQTPEEAVADSPRLRPKESAEYCRDHVQPKDIRSFVSIVTEHNRTPGVFDYNYSQNFYSTFPEVERESYITLGGKASRRVHDDEV
jgi:hypothetical protein